MGRSVLVDLVLVALFTGAMPALALQSFSFAWAGEPLGYVLGGLLISCIVAALRSMPHDYLVFALVFVILGLALTCYSGIFKSR